MLTPPPIPLDGPGPTVVMQPVAAAERIATLDFLRGFALLGILLVNVELFSWPMFYAATGTQPWATRLDATCDWVVAFLAEGKFYPLFSFLFGLGIAIQMQRARDRNQNFSAMLGRRLLALLGIGLLHAFLIWEGDILAYYAVCGFVLLAFQQRKPGTLLIWAGICLIIPVLIYGFLWAAISLASLLPEAARMIEQELAKERQNYETLIRENLRIFSQGTLAEIFVRRAKNVAIMWQYTWLFAPTFLGMFLLGLYAGQRRILQDISAHRQLFVRVVTFGLALGLPLNVFYAIASSQGSLRDIDLLGMSSLAALALGGPVLCLAYAAALTLGSHRLHLHHWLRPVTAAGRMALTNYLLQSLVCTTLCYSYGFGWYGSLGRAAGIGVALIFYFAQASISCWWLARFRFGPAEWAWRTCTYAARQPMRLTAGAGS